MIILKNYLDIEMFLERTLEKQISIVLKYFSNSKFILSPTKMPMYVKTNPRISIPQTMTNNGRTILKKNILPKSSP